MADLEKYIFPVGIVALAFFAFNRFFPKKETELGGSQILDSSGNLTPYAIFLGQQATEPRGDDKNIYISAVYGSDGQVKAGIGKPTTPTTGTQESRDKLNSLRASQGLPAWTDADAEKLAVDLGIVGVQKSSGGSSNKLTELKAPVAKTTQTNTTSAVNAVKTAVSTAISPVKTASAVVSLAKGLISKASNKLASLKKK